MTREFILNTLLPYKEDPSTCATNAFGNCMYLDDKGRKCALGKHMKEGPWQLEENKNINTLSDEYTLNHMLTDEALDQNISIDIWSTIQSYHDRIADESSWYIKSNVISELE